MKRSHNRLFRFAMFLPMCALGPMLLLSPRAMAQDAPPAGEAEETKHDDTKKDEQETSSLDELLGLEEDASAKSAREAAETEAKEELEQALLEQQISDAFKEAIAKMALSVDLLGEKFDSGLGTQRVQEDILAKLDVLIESAKKQQSKNSSKSSSKSQSKENQQPRPQQQNQDQQSQSQSQRSSNPADSSNLQPPPGQEGDINSLLLEDRIEWGYLPERIRDQLMQAMNDDPSALYRRLTNKYFERLAEEASR